MYSDIRLDFWPNLLNSLQVTTKKSFLGKNISSVAPLPLGSKWEVMLTSRTQPGPLRPTKVPEPSLIPNTMCSYKFSNLTNTQYYILYLTHRIQQSIPKIRIRINTTNFSPIMYVIRISIVFLIVIMFLKIRSSGLCCWIWRAK